jgi:gliding motility-associated-like protein
MLTVSGGSPPYTYNWSNGANTQNISGLANDVYEVEINDVNGCKYKTKTLLVAPPVINASTKVHNISCSELKDGSIEIVDIVGGIPPYIVEFFNGTTGLTLEDLDAGVYNYSITDKSGCAVSKQFEIYESNKACLFIPSAFSPNGDGINDTWEIKNIEIYPDASVRVFSRWNIDVFRAATYRPWDGYYNGNLVEPGVYYYAVDLHDGSEARTGTLVVAR